MQKGLQPPQRQIISPRIATVRQAGFRRWLFRSLQSRPQDRQKRDGHGRTDIFREKQRRLEAVLFLSPHGITSRKAAKLAGLADATEVRTLIRDLNQLYDSQLKPYRVEEVAGGYAIWTRARFAAWLRKLAYVPGELHLVRSALETLAIVAYRQPIMRAEIEAIRGVGSSEILKQLMEMDLVRINGRSEDLGRPYFYGTTQRFLQMFGLRSADRLPRIEWVNLIEPAEANPSSDDFATESEVKESTVRTSINVATFSGKECVDEHTLDEAATLFPALAIDEEEDEDEFFDDDDDDDDDDIDDWEEEEDDSDDVEDEEDLDDLDDSDEDEEDWEEVEEETDELEEDEEEDDDWDDDDDDWDDDDDDDDDWE